MCFFIIFEIITFPAKLQYFTNIKLLFEIVNFPLFISSTLSCQYYNYRLLFIDSNRLGSAALP